MSDTDIWENVKNSLFWQAGTLSWSRSLKKWVSIAAGTQKLYSTAYDSVCLIDQDYKYRDRKSTRLNSSHMSESRMPSSA